MVVLAWFNSILAFLWNPGFWSMNVFYHHYFVNDFSPLHGKKKSKNQNADNRKTVAWKGLQNTKNNFSCCSQQSRTTLYKRGVNEIRLFVTLWYHITDSRNLSLRNWSLQTSVTKISLITRQPNTWRSAWGAIYIELLITVEALVSGHPRDAPLMGRIVAWRP